MMGRPWGQTCGVLVFSRLAIIHSIFSRGSGMLIFTAAWQAIDLRMVISERFQHSLAVKSFQVFDQSLDGRRVVCVRQNLRHLPHGHAVIAENLHLKAEFVETR